MLAPAMPNILKIVQAGHPVLRQKARRLTPEELRTPEIARLIEDMRETMRDAPGVGLAAPQIGLPLQLVVIEDKPEYSERADAEEMRARGRTPVPFQVMANPRLHIVDATPVEFLRLPQRHRHDDGGPAGAGGPGRRPGSRRPAGDPVRRGVAGAHPPARD